MNITYCDLTTLKETTPNIIIAIDLDILRENEKYLALIIFLYSYTSVHSLRCRSWKIKKTINSTKMNFAYISLFKYYIFEHPHNTYIEYIYLQFCRYRENIIYSVLFTDG